MTDETKRTKVGQPDTAPWVLYLCCLLLVICTIPWRQKTYFAGGLDPVVVGKGLVGAAAVALAAYTSHRRRPAAALGGHTILLAALYLGISVIGGWAAGTALPSAVVAVRVAMALATVAFLLRAVGIERLVHALVRSLGIVGLVACVTGVGTIASGRWEGGVPPLAPNEIAFISGVVLVYLVHGMMHGTAGGWAPIVAAGVFGVMWLTGSRTTTATLVLAIIVMLVQARTFSVSAFLGMVLAVPVVAYVVVGTSVVSNLLLRGGDQNVATLSSRTIAWNAAITMDVSTFQRWLGGGLTMKHIPVTGQFWREQLLDSSWVSALVQTGVSGLAVVLVWVVAAVWGALVSPRRWRVLWLGLLTFILPRSLLESGLFDASTTFLVFTLLSLAGEKVTRASGAPTQAPIAVDDLPPARVLSGRS
jgi:hypothetical protein